MVMATPSPQQVGREFVRQYYTLLHEAPEVLHRFYSSGSTFVHGGVDRPGMTEEPVVGQVEIDKKIKQLSFKDCHTKIRQVDSQSTIGSGVVVQVTGELSNNGEPMRRFMQTFVLAPQTPKKYYVHNDIFRYQDEVYHDNSDAESEEPNQQQQQQQQVEQKSVLNTYYQTEEVESVVDQELEQQIPPQSAPQQIQVEETPAAVDADEAVKQPEPCVTPVSEEAKTEENYNINGDSNPETEATINAEVDVEIISTEVAKENKVDLYQEPEPVKPAVQVKEEIIKETTSEKNSWAKIISSSSSTAPIVSTSSTSNMEQTFQNVQPPRFKETQITNKPVSKPAPNGFPSKYKPRNPPQQQQQQTQQSAQAPQQQQQPQQTQQQQQQQPAAQIKDSEESEKRLVSNSTKYPDDQQVFVGNLSQEISDAELRSFFGQYGKVIEVRINSNTKQLQGRRLPNYGFVVFEDRVSVENLLAVAKSSLVFRNEKNEYRLNIEEKRARQGRVASGYGGKSNRPNRSMSNGSRNGGGGGGGGGGNQKKNTIYENSNYGGGGGGGGGFGEKRKEESQISESGGAGNIRKSNPRRS